MHFEQGPDCSSFRGGSETLIAAVFESSSPFTLAPLEEPEPVTPEEPDEPVDPGVMSKRSSRAFDSPLAKLFGKPAAQLIDAPSKRAPDVEKLQKELADVRASQLRMEELLNKVLAGK